MKQQATNAQPSAAFSEVQRELVQRRAQTRARLAEFAACVREELGAYLPRVVGEHTTAYATGSGGRGELGAHSDLDLFLVRADGAPSRIDAVQLQAAIVRASAGCAFPEPSGDGKFLTLHGQNELDEGFGGAEDDAKNGFTVRLLLLLESWPLLGERAYERLIDAAIERYWQHDAEHRDRFLPYVLVNDIIRWWRSVLLNHEHRLARKSLSAEPAIERRIGSYKLRFARCVTCFATLARVLAEAREHGCVRREAMKAMTQLTPIERLESIATLRCGEPARADLQRIVVLYSEYLRDNDGGNPALRELLRDDRVWREKSLAADELAERVFALLRTLGEGNKLYRYLVV